MCFLFFCCGFIKFLGKVYILVCLLWFFMVGVVKCPWCGFDCSPLREASLYKCNNCHFVVDLFVRWVV